jgi:S-formylglutathione hydrolase FrmB
MKHEILLNYRAYDIQNFNIETLVIESEALKHNPLRDPSRRYNPILVPKTPGPWPVVVVLAGFTGNAPFYLNGKFNETNAVQVIDQASARGEAPEALYVFVDALTSWGGSQFINSAATGLYEDYIMTELIPAVKTKYLVQATAEHWCVTGGSSGGYGALHLGSKFPEVFGKIAAVAPDSFFEASLLPDLFQTLPLWGKYQESGLKALEELRNGRLMKNKNWHSLLNALGMAACYAPKGTHGDFEFPMNVTTGEKKADVWKRYLEKDPIHFLAERMNALKKLSGIYLDVGTRDNFHLQYGVRQISQLLKSHDIDHEVVEFEGTHFDISERREEVWKWLVASWRS